MAATREDTVMDDFSQTHKPHHQYTYRLPTPPRIVVPPPTITTEVPELHVSNRSPSEQSINISFLKELDMDSIIQTNTLLEWSYERRRQAQMILPWLYLGPLTAAKDKEWLKSTGITMVMTIRSRINSMNGAMQIAQEACGEVTSIEAATYWDLVGKLSETTRRINEHIAKVRRCTESTGKPQLGKVLVFCESGNEKSAAVAAAYLMETLDDFDYVKSMQVCQAQRFCVNFEDSLKNILRSHWDILIARRSVATSRSEVLGSTAIHDSLTQVVRHLEAPHSSALKTKRSIDDMDDDMDMSDDADPSDVLRFTGRDITPFADA